MEQQPRLRPTVVRERYAKAKARLLIKELGLTGPPVDVEAVAGKMVAVLRYHDIPELDYAVVFRYRGQYFVSVNVSSPGRMRWSLAHELGHIVLGHYTTYIPDTLAEERLTEKERKILDREVDIFVREFLMPKAWVRRAAGGAVQFRDIDRLAEEFGVSWEAMMIRLDELGLFDKAEALF